MSLKRFEVWVRPDEVDQLDWCEKRELVTPKISAGELRLLSMLFDSMREQMSNNGCNQLQTEELSHLTDQESVRLAKEIDGAEELRKLPDWMVAEHLFEKLKASL